MQQWEYVVLTVAYVDDPDGGQIKFVNGRLLENWKGENWRLPDALASYGKRGWELTTSVWRRGHGEAATVWDTLYILKRLKPQTELGKTNGGARADAG